MADKTLAACAVVLVHVPFRKPAPRAGLGCSEVCLKVRKFVDCFLDSKFAGSAIWSRQMQVDYSLGEATLGRVWLVV